MKPQPTNFAGVTIYKLAILPAKLIKGENQMNIPRAISTWCMILYFLLVGLTLFGLAIPGFLTAIFALGAAVFLFLGR